MGFIRHQGAVRLVCSLPASAISFCLVAVGLQGIGASAAAVLLGWLAVGGFLASATGCRVAVRVCGHRPLSDPGARLPLWAQVAQVNELPADKIWCYIAPKQTEVNAFTVGDRMIVLTEGFRRAYLAGDLTGPLAAAMLTHELGHRHHRASRYDHAIGWLTLPWRFIPAVTAGLVRGLSRRLLTARVGYGLLPVVAVLAGVQLAQARNWLSLGVLVLIGLALVVEPVTDAALSRSGEHAADRYAAARGVAPGLEQRWHAMRGMTPPPVGSHPPDHQAAGRTAPDVRVHVSPCSAVT